MPPSFFAHLPHLGPSGGDFKASWRNCMSAQMHTHRRILVEKLRADDPAEFWVNLEWLLALVMLLSERDCPHKAVTSHPSLSCTVSPSPDITDTLSHPPHPSPEKGYTSTSGSIIFTKATFWTNAHWSRIWCLLIQNDPKLLRYLHKCRILCFFQWSPLCIFAEIQMADWLNLVSCFPLFYSILLCRIWRLCKYLKSFGSFWINQHHILDQWAFVQNVAFVKIMDPEVEV